MLNVFYSVARVEFIFSLEACLTTLGGNVGKEIDFTQWLDYQCSLLGFMISGDTNA